MQATGALLAPYLQKLAGFAAQDAGWAMMPRGIGIMISMFLGIAGGWVAGVGSGVIGSADYIRGLQDSFVPFNITFALIKTVTFAFIITTVSSYHGYHTEGGALEVGKSSTSAVVYSSILILVFDYILTQLILT